MYYNGAMLRLLAHEIPKVFGEIFCNSDENKTFLQTDEMKEFIDSISSILVDKSYTVFQQKYKIKT